MGQKRRLAQTTLTIAAYTMEALFSSKELAAVEQIPTFQYMFPSITVRTRSGGSAIEQSKEGKFALFDFVPGPDSIQGIDVGRSVGFVCSKLAVLGKIHSDSTPSSYADGELMVLFTTNSDEKRFALLVCPLKYNSTAAVTAIDQLLKLKEVSMNLDLQPVIPGGGSRGLDGNCFTYLCKGAKGETTTVYYMKERLFIQTNLSGFVTSMPASFPSGINAQGSNASEYSDGLMMTMGLTNGDIFMDCNPVDVSGSHLDVAVGEVTGKVRKDFSKKQIINTIITVVLSSLLMAVLYLSGGKIMDFIETSFGFGPGNSFAPGIESASSFMNGLPIQGLSMALLCMTAFGLTWGITHNSVLWISAGVLSMWVGTSILLIQQLK